jgi:benzoyl-CoA reductase/2-hydroxyglutaryl-CoA dehydratase subunit BcrC/BadD/HgdB
MEAERLERLKKITYLHLAMEAKETLKKIKEDFPDRLESMEYFYNLFHRVYTENAPLKIDRKTIGIMCIQVPEELIYATGAVPVRLCNGAHAFAQVGAEFMPSKSCPLMKATMGMLYTDHALYRERLDMVVIPTTCDQKRKAGEFIESMGFNVYTLEIPPTKDTEEARYYWQNTVKRFALVLQEATGQRITRKRIREAIRRLNSARQQYRRLFQLRTSSPSLIYGKDVFLITNAYFFGEIREWTEALRRLNDELERRRDTGLFAGNRSAPRLLLTGSPPIFPNLKLPLLIEEAGGMIVADEVCSSSRLLYDAPVFDEANLYDMIPAIADRYLKPCTCPCFVPNNDRRRRLLEIAREFEVDGVVYQAYSGCQLYEMEQRSIARILQDEGIPMLYIETDYSPEDVGQLSTRIEAFIESIKSRRRRQN